MLRPRSMFEVFLHYYSYHIRVKVTFINFSLSTPIPPLFVVSKLVPNLESFEVHFVPSRLLPIPSKSRFLLNNSRDFNFHIRSAILIIKPMYSYFGPQTNISKCLFVYNYFGPKMNISKCFFVLVFSRTTMSKLRRKWTIQSHLHLALTIFPLDKLFKGHEFHHQ